MTEATQERGDRSRTPLGEPIDPDAHGQAALLLVESLMHTLVETRVLDRSDVLALIRTACEVKIEAPVHTNESTHRMRASLRLLNSIASSFETDGPMAANDKLFP